MTFWIAAAVLAAVILGVALRPLLRKPAEAAARAEYDVNVYKDQLKELERDAAEGRISAGELAAARLEIERRLLAAAGDGGDAPKADDGKRGRSLALVLGVALPALASLLYLDLGRPGVPDFPLAARTDLPSAEASAGAMPGSMPGDLTQALDRLKVKLEKNPSDADGWILLGRTYVSMDRAQEAADAFSRALPLAGRDPSLVADYAEARLVAGNGEMTKEIHDAFVEAITADPTLSKPWFYLGFGRAQQGNFRSAVQFWTDLLTISPPDAPYVEGVKEQIALAAKEGGFDPKSIVPSPIAKKIAAQMPNQSMPASPPGAAPSAPSAAPGPSQADMNAAAQMSAEDRQAFVRSMVERLAGRLAENPNDPEGWQRLIRAYEVLGETEKAAEARAKLKAVTGN